MDKSIIASTLLLTLLLMVGLVFFIRASVKERTQKVELIFEEPLESVVSHFQEYFQQRSYQTIALDTDKKQGTATFEGFVRPSWFLAIFLTFLAGIGLSCSMLVFSFLYPSASNFFPLLVLLAPGAGYFYWQKAGRIEQVDFKIKTLDNSSENKQSLVTIKAHRDELIELQRSIIPVNSTGSKQFQKFRED
ncbi:MAG: cofactor assembly of complex C subunit B [Prochloraceae cyanobacterium]|nr:cofactor assembly of complex C subunit B [Prochloraceae cyanobacterium]